MGQLNCYLIGIFISIYLVSITSGATIPTEDTKLRFVHFIFRHGKRAPSVFFKDDPNSASYTGGLGKLLNAGKEDSFNLGKWARERYVKGGFLSEKVSTEDMYIRSTDKDRTLNTAQLFAAGVYSPPKGDEVWNDDLGTKWQPVAVHTIPLDVDPFVDVYILNNCPRFAQILDILQATPEGKKIETDNKDLGDRVFNHTGVLLSKPRDFIDVVDIIDVAEANHFKIPEFLTNDVEKMNELGTYFVTKYVKTDELVGLGGGFLINEIANRMNDIVTNKTHSGLKAYANVAHDYTLMFILSTLHVFNDIVPTFSSAIILELHEDKQGEFFLQVLYKNDTSMEPMTLTIPNCEEKCPWEQVYNLTSQYFIKDLPTLKEKCVEMSPEEVSKKQTELDEKFP